MSVKVHWLTENASAAKLINNVDAAALETDVCGINYISDLRNGGNLRTRDLVLLDSSTLKTMNGKTSRAFFGNLVDRRCSCVGILNADQIPRQSVFIKASEEFDMPVLCFGNQYSMSDIADNLYRAIISSETESILVPATDRRKDAPHDTNAFVEKILMNENANPQEIKMLCHLYGFDISTPRICFVIQPEIPEDGGASQQMKHVRSLIREAAGSATDNNPFRIFYMQYLNNLILFAFHNSFATQSTALDSAKRMAIDVAKTLINTDIRCHIGISKACTGWETIRLCFTQALQALELGSRMHPEWTVYSYRDDDVYQFLINNLSRDMLVSFYNESIRPLADYDRANNTDMLSTLHMYFECGRSLTQTAEKLFIHRNTMLYRMERIQQILDVDLKRTNESFRIQLGLYIMHLIQLPD